MSRGPAVQVQGARTLRRTLKAAGLDVTDLKAAHKAVADLVASRARPATPHRTGALAGSVRTSGTASAAIVRAGRASVPYAGPIHWGWPSRHIPAQPWIADAAAATQPGWEALYLTALTHIIDTIEGAPGP
jgi:hypothetical protein